MKKKLMDVLVIMIFLLVMVILLLPLHNNFETRSEQMHLFVNYVAKASTEIDDIKSHIVTVV